MFRLYVDVFSFIQPRFLPLVEVILSMRKAVEPAKFDIQSTVHRDIFLK